VHDVTLKKYKFSPVQVASLQSKTLYKSTMIGKTSLLSMALAIAFGSTTLAANAAGLGRLSVQSALGQPLRAEVEVTALGKDESNGVTAKLAAPEAFKQAGLEYNPALANLRFAVEKRPDGRHVVKITSNQPINEPFVDLMVELNWPTGRFVREYTFLLDPSDLKVGQQTIAGTEARVEPIVPPAPIAPVQPAPVQPAPQIAQAPVAAPAVAPAPVPVAPAKAKPAAKEAVVPVAPAAAGQGASSGSYDVKRGDILARIAARNKPASVTLDQAIIAIYQANPNAFLGNVNRLKSGVSLAIPDETAMASVSAAEARKEVQLRTAGFSNYRKRLAGAAKTAPKTAKSGQSAEGKIGAGVVDSVAKTGQSDVLKISKGTGKAGSTSAMGAGEAKVARDNALAESTSRVQALEKNVSELNKLLALKDQQLADLDKRMKAAAVTAAAAKTGKEGVIEKPASAKTEVAAVIVPTVPKVEPPKIEPPKVEPPKVEPPKVELPKVEAKVEPPTIEPPKVEPPKVEPPKVEPPKVEPPKVEAAPVEPPKVEPPKVEATKPAEVMKPTPKVAAPKGFFDDFTNDYPWALPALGALALAGGGYGIYAMNRRRKSEKFEDSLMEGEAFSANSLFGTTGGQNVDTNAALSTSAAASSKTETGVEVGSTEVDPIAEAEVYIAYGREGQAEEILKDALRKQNDRQAIRLKLLEIYAGRKDVAAFESMANEMHGQTRGKNEEWPKVVTLGLSIDPTNALYTGAGSPKTGAVAAAVAGATGLAGFGASALSSGKAAADSSMDSLQAASEIVPAIPDFMAETNFGNTKQLGGNTAEAPATLDFDFNSSTITKAAEKVTSMPAAEKTMASLDLPDLDLPMKATKAAAEPVSKFDAMDFSIDLPALEALTGNGKPAAAVGHAMDFGTTASSPGAPNTQSAAWQEMATKLDLAAAYEEIGDKDGARELLEEVAKGGDAAQQQKAKSMMSKLG
jgi:pilus assembly protein FimV